MKIIENKTFDEERALYGSHGLLVRNTNFDGPADGESAFKECSDIEVEHCFFNLRYPFWHTHGLKISDSEMTELCRASLWYSDHIEITDTKMHGIKALRECSDVVIRDCDIIVSRETYQAVQELQKSKSKGNHVPKNRYPFSGMLKCPVCGHNYRRQVVNGTAYWLCSYKAAGRTECAGDRVREDAVMSAFIRMSDKLAQNREELLGDLIRQLEKLQSRTSTSGEQVYQLNRQIADVNAQSLVVAQLYKNGVLNHAEHASRSRELDRKVSELRSERRRILTEDEDDEIIESLKELNETIAEYVPTDSFDTDLFGQIVESITVIGRNTLRFRLAGGLTLTEKFEERSA